MTKAVFRIVSETGDSVSITFSDGYIPIDIELMEEHIITKNDIALLNIYVSLSKELIKREYRRGYDEGYHTCEKNK